MKSKNYVAFVNADGSVDLFERVYDDIAQSAVWGPVPVDVIAEPKAAVSPMVVTAGLLTLLAAAIPFVWAILTAMVDLSGGVA